MLLSKLGEFAFINRIARRIRLDASVVKGSGDDCAVLSYTRDTYLLATCDMIVEGVDFTRATNPKLIGRKALAISLSDIAACAGIPRHALVSLGMPKHISLRRADAVAEGMLKLAREYKVNIVGGDISRAPRLTIDTTVLGEVKRTRLVLRSGARAGDSLFVTGSLGGSRQAKHLTFTPRIREAQFLALNFGVHAMIDVSDGLTQDLAHILKASSVEAILEADSIPCSRNAGTLRHALIDGEDFELLFTLAPADASRLVRMRKKGITRIGSIIAGSAGRVWLRRKDQTLTPLTPGGFTHF